jgi:hypothetical protein
MESDRNPQPAFGRALRVGKLCVLAALALLAPRVAEACAVCVSSRDDGTQWGFLLGTAIMLPVPFLVVGGLVYFLWRRARSAPPEVTRPASSPS